MRSGVFLAQIPNDVCMPAFMVKLRERREERERGRTCACMRCHGDREELCGRSRGQAGRSLRQLT